MKEQEFNSKILALRDAMYRLARAILGNCDDAGDAVQDTLAKLWRMRGELGGYDNLGAFVMTVMRNDCFSRLRKTKRYGFTGIETLDKIHRGADPSADTDDLAEIIRGVMARLPEKQRTAVHLRDIEEMEFGEIATIMEMDEGAVRTNLSRARKKMREELTKIMNHGI